MEPRIGPAIGVMGWKVRSVRTETRSFALPLLAHVVGSAGDVHAPVGGVPAASTQMTYTELPGMDPKARPSGSLRP